MHPVILENVKRCKYTAPTPIQAYCIPAVLTGHDVVGIAQTGKSPTYSTYSCMLTSFRLRKDCGFPSAYLIKAYGEGSHATRPTTVL